MLKVLRRYRGPAIAIGGSLLMVAFLIPEVVRQMQGDPSKTKVAEVNGRKITAKELGESEREYSALKLFFEPLMTQVVGVKDGTHWYLLTHEAMQAGLVGEPSNGEQYMSTVVKIALEYQSEIALQRKDYQTYFELRSPEGRAKHAEETTAFLARARMNAAGQTQLTLDKFDMALAKVQGVQRMMNAFNQAARISDIAAHNIVKRQADQAVVDYVAVPSERVAAQVEEPTEAELTAQFTQYQNIKPGTGLFGFGYVLPPRFKLEWLKLDRTAIANAIQLDPIEVNKFYSRNRDKYKGEFAAEKTNVERDLRQQRVSDIMTDADRVIRTEVARPVRKLESDGPYKKLPTDWAQQRPSFETIAPSIVDNIKSTQKITIPLPTVTIKASDWLSAQDVANLPDLGLSQSRVGTRSIPVPALLLQTREIAGANEIGLQIGVPFIEATTTDAAGNRYYFTIIDAKPEAAAASLDEVRATAIKDVKAQKAYVKLLGEVNAQLALAATAGVKSVADLYNNQSAATTPDKMLDAKVKQPVSAKGQLPPEIDAQEFRDAVLKAAGTLDQLKPAGEQDQLARTLVVGIPSKHTVVIAQITDLKPVTIESYRSMVESQTFQMQREEVSKILADNPTTVRYPYAFDAMKTRFAFKRLGKSEEDADKTTKPKGT